MTSQDRERVYLVPPAVYAPVIISTVALVWALASSAWALVALPFVWLGAAGAAPNLNLANGCLAYAAMIVGGITSTVHEPLGVAILGGAVAGYYTGVLEKRIRMRPYAEETCPPSLSSPLHR